MDDRPRQQPEAAATRELGNLSSTRGSSTTQVLRVVMLFLLGSVLLLLAGLTLAGNLVGLAITAPLFVLFSPVLIPAAFAIGLTVAGFLTFFAFGVTALVFFTWMVKYILRTRNAEAPTSSASRKRSDSEPSSTSTSVIENNYYVFLSFRGLDTRKGFVDHLHRRLTHVGLPFHPSFTFRDDEKLRFGQPIAENLLSAIKCSKVSIPVISENYAASEWCLREIIQIMDCVDRGEQKVLPVLYKVEPKDVKLMEGKFGQAFKSRMHRFKEDVKKQGPKALQKALTLRVYESGKFASGSEAELIEELIRVIMDEQQHDFLVPLPGKLVGTDDRVAEVMKLVDADPFETRIIGICGIGGIGKTTLATNIYNKLFKEFEYHSFLMDIREQINQKGVECIQSLLISDLTKSPESFESRVRDSLTGIGKIRLSCEKKKVLILLDDVGHRQHLDNLIGGCNFKSGSRIIITCRDKALLRSIQDFEYKSYELEEMNSKDSMLLFSLYAFGAKQPPIELATLSEYIVATTGGLPLALIVIGSLLKGVKDQVMWRGTLENLRKLPHMDVQEKLKISYDTLGFDEKRIFLDIACFFIGYDKRIATYLWEDFQLTPKFGLARMIDLSLIKYDDNNELRMHDQLRDLGRDIARSDKKPWDRERLWDEEAMEVLGRKEKNENIEALRLDERGSKEFMELKSFKNMPNLKFLHVKDVDFNGDFKGSISELRWLKWERCPDSFEATDVHLKRLVVLDLSSNDIRGNCISENWRGWSSIKMEKLKVLNLSRCTALKRNPNLSAFKSLEMLILEFCENLEEIDPSIGDVKCLTSLNLSGCDNLKKLPLQLGQLKCLVSLNLSSCSRLQELPEEIGKLENLKELAIDGVSIKEIPSWIGDLKNLEILNAQGCDSLVELPNSIGKLVNLLTLDLRFCYKLKGFPKSIGSLVKLRCLLLGNMPLPSEEMYSDGWESDQVFYLDNIPYSIGQLKSLTELHLTCAKISELPESIGELKKLKILKIAGCKDLGSLPGTISRLDELEELDATECKSLKGGVPINGLSSLKILRLGKICHTADLFGMHIDNNPQLQKDSSLLSFQPHLDLTNCNLPASLTVLEVTSHKSTLPELSHLTNLKELSFQFCQHLKFIPVLPSRILNLWVFWCGELEELPDLSSLTRLSELRIIGCSKLIKIELEGLKSLRELSICGCMKLRNLNGLGQLDSLRDLEIKKLGPLLMTDDLDLVQCIGRLKNFRELRIDSCQSLKRPDISQLTHLQVLWVTRCKNIAEIKCLERLKKLRSLNIKWCRSIETLPDLSLFDNLEYLSIHDCPKLRDVRGQVEFVTWFEKGKNIGTSRMN